MAVPDTDQYPWWSSSDGGGSTHPKLLERAPQEHQSIRRVVIRRCTLFRSLIPCVCPFIDNIEQSRQSSAPWKRYNQSIVHSSTFLISESTSSMKLTGKARNDRASNPAVRSRVNGPGSGDWAEPGTCQKAGLISHQEAAESSARFAQKGPAFRFAAAGHRCRLSSGHLHRRSGC
jgi:hypothetical protein